MPSANGRYRIQAVAAATGVPAATLRAWERRYGVPTPSRTATAYRLYSEQDMERVRRMRALIERGISASRAAEEVLADGAVAEPTQAVVLDGDPFAPVVQRIVDAALRFDERGLEEAVALAASAGSALTIFERVLGPSVDRIGELWHRGEATVAQEHLLSYVVLRNAMELLHLAAPDAGRTALLCCFAEEEHLLPAIGAALRIASWGFRPIVLGARTPPSALASGVRGAQPDLVGLSVTVPPEPAKARELVDAYADACGNVPWIVGGEGAPPLRSFVEARGGMVVEGSPDGDRAGIERFLARARRRPRSGGDARRPADRATR